MAHFRSQEPYVPREGSRVWGYVLPILLAAPLVMFALLATLPMLVVASVVVAAAGLVLSALADWLRRGGDGTSTAG